MTATSDVTSLRRSMVHLALMSVTRPLQRRTEEAFSNSNWQMCEDPVVAWLGRGTEWGKLMCSGTSEHPNEIGDRHMQTLTRGASGSLYPGLIR